MKVPKAKSGWDTGYFRVSAASGDPLSHQFYNVKTKEIKDLPYDHSEEDWFPLYVYMGSKP